MNKPKYHHRIEQGTDEWLSARLGIVTASDVGNIMTSTRKPAKNETMRSYACQIAAEREMGYIEDHYESFDMMRGHFQEGIARDIYSETFAPVSQCGIITLDIGDGIIAGASPDGLVGEDGMIEIKSRLSKFQIKTIIANEVPNEYLNQIQTQLLVSGRKWCDFVQYSNGMPLFVKRVYPDEEHQEKIIDALVEFELVVCDMISGYQQGSNGLVKTERVDIVFNDDVITETGE